jgi:hypothetical protein
MQIVDKERWRGKAKLVSKSQDSIPALRPALWKSILQSRSKLLVTYLHVGLVIALYVLFELFSQFFKFVVFYNPDCCPLP